MHDVIYTNIRKKMLPTKNRVQLCSFATHGSSIVFSISPACVPPEQKKIFKRIFFSSCFLTVTFESIIHSICLLILYTLAKVSFYTNKVSTYKTCKYRYTMYIHVTSVSFHLLYFNFLLKVPEKLIFTRNYQSPCLFTTFFFFRKISLQGFDMYNANVHIGST